MAMTYQNKVEGIIDGFAGVIEGIDPLAQRLQRHRTAGDVAGGGGHEIATLPNGGHTTLRVLRSQDGCVEILHS